MLDLRQNGFGLEATLNQLDYRFNPRKGWFLNLRAVAGFNSVLRNSTIEALRDPADPEFQFSSLYDAVAGRVARYRLEAQADYFIPLFVRSTLKLSMRGGGIFLKNPYTPTSSTALAAVSGFADLTRRVYLPRVLS